MDAFDTIDAGRSISAALDALTALTWATLAQSFWRSRGTARPRGTLMWLVRIVGGLLAAHFGFHVVLDLVPFGGDPLSDPLYLALCVFSLVTTVAVLPALRHLVPLGTIGGHPPGRVWLALNYGLAVLALAAAWLFWPASVGPPVNVVQVFLPLMTALTLWDAGRLARRRWRPVFMADLRYGGFLALAVVLMVGVLATILTEPREHAHSLASSASRTFLALALAAPFALRILGEVVRRFLVTAVKLAAAIGIYVGARAAVETPASPRLGLLVDGAAVLSLVVVLGPGGTWLRSTVDRLVLRQSHRWAERLLGFLHTLTPEVGIEECCRRSVEEVVRRLSLRGAGILLDDGGGRWMYGRLDLEPIARLWPGAAELPEGAFDLLWLRDVHLQEELYEAAVTWIVPIKSPQKRWGHLFIAAGAIGTAASDAKLETLESFAHQLALVLDTADLLARVVGVERDLAQAEKLAALGETAARIAHEIRNPVTAARSLAQLMAREPTSPANAEHAVLVTRELDRVERQVKALLQFARGDEPYRFETVRLAELVARAVADLEASLELEELEIALELDAGVTVRADPERFRQVVVNLVANAVEALAAAPRPKRLQVSVAASNGDALLAIEDSGTGVGEEMLPRLFEPFVSQKAQGTGLGLAIAKRIVEAHRGRIEAQSGPRRGMVFRVWLPTS